MYYHYGIWVKATQPIPGRLNVHADQLSRRHQTIQMEEMLHPSVCQTINGILILIAPNWTKQAWFSTLLNLLGRKPYKITRQTRFARAEIIKTTRALEPFAASASRMETNERAMVEIGFQKAVSKQIPKSLAPRTHNIYQGK